MTSLSIEVGTPRRSVRSAAERHIAFLKDRALAADAGRALNDAGQTDANAGDLVHFKPGVADATADAILDKIGDHGGGLPVDPNRQGKRGEDVGAEICDSDGDLVCRELDANDIARRRD